MGSKVNSADRNDGGDPIGRYMRELSSSLRIRDVKARDQILGSVRKGVVRAARTSKGYEGLVAELGSPRDIASKLSDSKNWVVQMGTPILPKVPLVPAISRRGALMISVFIIAMFLVSGALFVILPRESLVYPIVLFLSALIYLLLSTMFYSFIGYSLTYRSLKASGIGVEPCPRYIFDLQLAVSGGLVLVLDMAMVIFPLFGDRSTLMVSVPIGVPPLVLTVAVILMAKGSRGSLPAGLPARSSEAHTKNKK